MVKKEITDEEKLIWYTGKVLSAVTEIEKALSWRLRVYFFPKSNIQSTIFYQSILNTNYFGFERKIELYNQIPYFRKLKNFTRVINSLRFVQKLRNDLAHWELWNFGVEKKIDEITIYNPITFKKRKLNKKLMIEFIAHDQFLLKSFGWRYRLEEKYGVKNRNIVSSRIIEVREFARLLAHYNKIK